MRLKSIAFVCLIAASCGEQPKNNEKSELKDGFEMPRVIYGDDDRIELISSQDPRVLEKAKTTVALIDSKNLKSSGGNRFEISGQKFGTAYSLCADEPFRDQPTAAFCSGAFVGPNLVLTAGHCITTQADCDKVRFVQGYENQSLGQTSYSVPEEQIYLCSEIVFTVKESMGKDFALIRTNRASPSHLNYTVRRSGEISPGDGVLVMGHPTGLPLKITPNGKVRSVSSNGYFVTNLDTFGGNSGSPVFNSQTMELEGVLVRGEEDFENVGGCFRSKKCSENNCRGEDVTKISEALAFLPGNTPTPTPTPGLAREIFSLKPKLSIPDNNPTGVVSEISVPTTPQGRFVVFWIDIEHTWSGDLDIEVTSPDGVTIKLQSREGGSTPNIKKFFGMDPETRSKFAGLSYTQKPGSWKLRVRDLARRDVGVVRKWSVRFELQ